MRCRGANCPNVAALFGSSITGVMSNITAVADFVRESKTGLGIPGRMGIRSDLQPLYNLPLLDNEGGSQLISCLKKSFIACLTLRLTRGILTSFRFGGLPGGGDFAPPLPIFCLWTDFDDFFF